MLATEQLSDVAGEATEYNVGGVNDVPVTLNVAWLRGVRTHVRSLRFVFVSSLSLVSAQKGRRALRGA